MTKEKFEKLVEEGIRAIPEKFLKKLDNVDIIIEDEPTLYQLEKIREKRNLLIFGLYEGIPQTRRGHYGQVLPDKITIFKKPIERRTRSRQRRGSPEAAENEIRKIVKNTVWHEIAHHFGMDEKKVKEAEHRRKK